MKNVQGEKMHMKKIQQSTEYPNKSGIDPGFDKWTENLRDVPNYTKIFILNADLGLATLVRIGIFNLRKYLQTSKSFNEVY